MDQEKHESQELEAFREQYRAALPEFIEFVTDLGDGLLYPPDPASMNMDERNFEMLNLEELNAVRAELHNFFEINPNDPNKIIRRYSSMAPEGSTTPGEMQIEVKRTNVEGIVLQEMTYGDRAVRWVAGPDADI